MASLGLSGLLAGRVRFERWPSLVVVSAALVTGGVTLVFARNPAVATAAQAVLAALAIAIGIFLTRLLHDAIPSDIRSGVSSTVGAGSWIVFLPFSLAFGAVSERWGVHTAGTMILGIIAAAIVLLVLVVARGPPHTGRGSAPTAMSSPSSRRPRPSTSGSLPDRRRRGWRSVTADGCR